MPHECTRCQVRYADDPREIIIGCPCGSSVFLYKRANGKELSPGSDDRVTVELVDTSNALGEDTTRNEAAVGAKEDVGSDALEDGVFEIDLSLLMRKTPVINEADGIYRIVLDDKLPRRS